MTYQTYLNPNIDPLPTHIRAAVEQSPIRSEAFIPFDKAVELIKPGYFDVENGYSLNQDGSASVSVLTDMPGVTPAMWHWWFGWHGDSSEKYKLWHPNAHVSAEWKDKRVGEVAYINRVSHICEYIGKPKETAAIQFQEPASIGLPNFDPQRSDAVYIVARIGLIGPPIDFGWLIHQVRKTDTGSEMRSRFWMGGPHFGGRNQIGRLLIPFIRRVRKIPEKQVVDLLEHCSEEMAHLAKFLPDLYADYHASK